MLYNWIEERPHGGGPDINPYAGPVTQVRRNGLSWEANWYDNRDKQDRNLLIELDPTNKQMTITESGGGGSSPTQVWQNRPGGPAGFGNKPYAVIGDVYSMEGVCITENGNAVTDKWNIYVTNLNLPQ
ncbi:hypothetical protein [Lichenicoccus sp.]|uniref:hypothetical protein n=1 Tax=Lichenicoccus sp. TaxID=2781899 RepID=UPI003D0B0262